MERQKTSLFHRLAAAAVSAGMLASLAACSKPPAETAAPKEPVTAEQAIAQLQEESEALGFENALDELVEKNTATIGGDTYIRLQQHYEGIPVYGKTIVYAANGDGQMTSVTGNVQDIAPDIDLTSTITPAQAQESIRVYAAEVLGMEQAEGLTLEKLSWADACIYTQNGPPVLAFAVTIGTDRVILDAHNGDILDWNCIIMADGIQYTGPEGTRSVTGAQPIDGSYILKDSQRNIYVYDAQGQTYWYPGTTTTPGAMFPDIPVLVQSPDTEFGDGDDNTASSGQAYTFLTELGNVYDFFAEMGEPGVGTFVGICNDLMNNPNDPSRGYFGKNGGGYCGPLDGIIEEALPDTDKPLAEITSAVVIIGSEYTANLTDHYELFGHEYQHTVFQKHAGKSNNDAESGAIDEGIADIMGELYESSRGNTDWEHGDRIIHDPSQAELPESVSDIRFNSDGDVPFRRKDGTQTATDFSHGCSTIISHSAYLMWNGMDGTESKKLSEQQLAELWYRAVLMMPSDCDFILCRQLVEAAAQSMENLTDEQRCCVREAFDAVGISSVSEDTEADYHLDLNGTLSVYDEHQEYYSGYTLTIHGNPMRLPVGDRKPEIGFYYNKTVKVDSAGPYQVDLPAGLYRFTISDAYSPVTYSFTVQVGPEYAANIDLITAYEDPLVVVVPEPVQVADAYYDSVTFEGESGYFHIPEIICSDDRLDNANAQIYRELYDILNAYVYGEYMDLAGMSYSWTQHSNLVSILVEIEPWFWVPEYLTFNVDIESGKLLTNQEAAGCFDYTPEAFDRMVLEQMQQKYDDEVLLYLDQISVDTDGAFDVEGNREQTLSAENMETVHVFISSSGDLCMAAHLYRPGIEHPDYWHLFNLTGSAEPQPPVQGIVGKIEAETEQDPPVTDSAPPELTYPISEAACYIIYENWIEGELDESKYAAVEKTYSPDSPHAFFSLEFYHLDDDGYSSGEMPDYYFEIDLLTGECRTGSTAGSRPYVFQAEDYYY